MRVRSQERGGTHFTSPASVQSAGLTGTGDTGHGIAVCPVCRREIGLRTDGTIRNHRVGSTRQTSWPCAGAGRRA